MRYDQYYTENIGIGDTRKTKHACQFERAEVTSQKIRKTKKRRVTLFRHTTLWYSSAMPTTSLRHLRWHNGAKAEWLMVSSVGPAGA